MDDVYAAACLADALGSKRPQNRLQQFPKANSRRSKYVPMALKLYAQTIGDATSQRFSERFDPVFSPDSVLITPQKSTPDASELYLNAAAAALSEVEKYDESAASVLLKVIDYFASSARLGAPDYHVLMRDRESVQRVAEIKQQEIQALKEENQALRCDTSEMRDKMFAAEEETCRIRLLETQLRQEIDNYEQEILFKNAQIYQLSEGIEKQSAIHLEQQRHNNELFSKNYELRNDYESAIVDADQAVESQKDTEIYLAAAQQYSSTLLYQIVYLTEESEAKSQVIAYLSAESKTAVEYGAEDKRRWETALKTLREDNSKLKAEMVKAFVSKQIGEHSLQPYRAHYYQSQQPAAHYDRLVYKTFNGPYKSIVSYYYTLSNASLTVALSGQSKTKLSNGETAGFEMDLPSYQDDLAYEAECRAAATANTTFDDDYTALGSNCSSDSAQWLDSADNQSATMENALGKYKARYQAYKRRCQKLKRQLQMARAIVREERSMYYRANYNMQQVVARSEPASNYISYKDLELYRAAVDRARYSEKNAQAANKLGYQSYVASAGSLNQLIANSYTQAFTAAKLDKYYNTPLMQSDYLQNGRPTEGAVFQSKRSKINIGSDNIASESTHQMRCNNSEQSVVPGSSSEAQDVILGKPDIEASEGETLDILGPRKPVERARTIANVAGCEFLYLNDERGKELLSRIENHIKSSNVLIHNYIQYIALQSTLYQSDREQHLAKYMTAYLGELKRIGATLHYEYLRDSESLAEIYSWSGVPTTVALNTQLQIARDDLYTANVGVYKDGASYKAFNSSALELKSTQLRSVIRQYNFEQIGDYSSRNAPKPYAEREFFFEERQKKSWEKATTIRRQNDVYLQLYEQIERARDGMAKFSSDDFERRRDLMLATIAFLRKSKNLHEADFKIIYKSLLNDMKSLPAYVHEQDYKTSLLKMQGEEDYAVYASKPVYTDVNPFRKALWIRDHIFQTKALIRLKAEADLQKEITESRFRFLTADEMLRRCRKAGEENVVRMEVLEPSALPLYVQSYGVCEGKHAVVGATKISDAVSLLAEYKYPLYFAPPDLSDIPLISDYILLSELTENILEPQTIKLHTGVRYFLKNPVDKLLTILNPEFTRETFTICCSTGYYLRLPFSSYVKTLPYILQTIRLAREQMDAKQPFPEAFVSWLSKHYCVGDIAQKLFYSIVVNLFFYSAKNKEVYLFLSQLNYGIQDYFVHQAIAFMKRHFALDPYAEATKIDSLQFSELYLSVFGGKYIVAAPTFWDGVYLMATELSSKFARFCESTLRIFDLYQKEHEITAAQLKHIFERLPMPFDELTVDALCKEVKTSRINQQQFLTLVFHFSLKDADELTKKAADMVKSADSLLIKKGAEAVKKYQQQRHRILQLIGLNKGAEAFVVCCQYCQEVVAEGIEDKEARLY